ncbi:uncharacterized protein [Haliotis asinina]|uniref:uncharacterized protein n=1 Tax=Haliotis asinina TaxID=109174 RepID=UPI0035319B7B
MYTGGRRPYEDMGGSEDPYNKKRKTDMWNEGGYSDSMALPPPPPFPYGNQTNTMSNISSMSSMNSMFDSGMDNYDNPWKMGRQYDNIGSSTVASSSTGADWNNDGGAWGGTGSSGYGGDTGYGGVSSYKGGSSFGRSSNWGGAGRGGRTKQFSFGNQSGDTDFTDDFAVLKAAEIQYKKQGTVDFDKIRKALQLVNQQSDGGRVKRGGRGGRGGNWNDRQNWNDNQGWNDGQSFGGFGGGGRGGRGRGFAKMTPYDKAAGFGGPNKFNRGMRGNQRGSQIGRGGPRGRGNRGGFGQVAPVHSLAKVSAIDSANMSMAEKMRRFALFIQNDSQRVNDIQTIENGLTGSKLGLKSDYQVEELLKVCNKMMFTGRLFIGSVFLARSVGANKKEVKHECFRKAVDVLKSKSVAAIMKMEDVGTEKMRAELLASLKDEGSSNPVMDAQKKVASLEEGREPAAGLVGLEVNFDQLIQYLNSGKANCNNVISELTQSFSASFCNLNHKYVEENTRLPNGKLWFKGKLTINDTLIASATSHKKKEAKLKTFEKAMVFLKTKPISVIMQGISLDEAEDMPTSDPLAAAAQGQDFKEDNASLPSERTLEKLKTLLMSVPEFPGIESVVNLLDVTAHQLQLVPTCVYRKGASKDVKSSIQCDLYLDNILLAIGEGEKRKDAQCDAYVKALDVLSTSTAEIIYNDFQRLTPEDTKGPGVLEVWVKGQSRTGESNLQRLKRMKLDPMEHGKDKNDIVLIEHHEWAFDRKRQAFCILNMSATQNAMLLEWKISPVGTFFKCEMYIQQELVGEACAPAKNAARNLSAGDALFKLYQTQTTIKVVSRDESNFWFTYETIQEKADKLKAESGDTGTNDMVPVTPDSITEEKPKMEEKEGTANGEGTTSEPLMANKWIKLVIEQMVEKFAKEENLEELLFGPGFPPGEKKLLNLIARSYDLRFSTKQNKEHAYSVIFRKFMPDKMAEILRKNGGHSGKYSIIPKELLPKHADIKDQLMPPPKQEGQKGKGSVTQSFETSGEYETAHSTFFDTSTSGSKTKLKSPFSNVGRGNVSFQTSTPRGGNKGKRGRGRGKGNKFVSGNLQGNGGDWDAGPGLKDEDISLCDDNTGDQMEYTA